LATVVDVGTSVVVDDVTVLDGSGSVCVVATTCVLVEAFDELCVDDVDSRVPAPVGGDVDVHPGAAMTRAVNSVATMGDQRQALRRGEVPIASTLGARLNEAGKSR
jgi:hypothetical protein